MKSYMILSRYFIQFTVVDIPVLISSMWLSASTPSMPIAWEQGYHQEYWTKYQTSEPCEVWPPWICINIIKNNIDTHRAVWRPTALYRADPFLANNNSITISGKCDSEEMKRVRFDAFGNKNFWNQVSKNIFIYHWWETSIITPKEW